MTAGFSHGAHREYCGEKQDTGGASEAYNGDDIHELKVVHRLGLLSRALHMSSYHCLGWVSTHEENARGEFMQSTYRLSL